MKVLKMRLFQESACYKKPFAYKVTETYPLPPYSTVKGMLHSILEAEEYIPMRISVQGDYESIFNSYNSMYFYKSNQITTMPLNTHMLFGVNLTIHIYAEETILNKILEKIAECKEFFSLGRREDLARMDYVDFIDIEEINVEDLEENIVIKTPIYIPKKDMPCELYGINYRLNWKYEIKDNIRQWDKIEAIYVDRGEEINEGKVLIDKQGDLVFFNDSIF